MPMTRTALALTLTLLSTTAAQADWVTLKASGGTAQMVLVDVETSPISCEAGYAPFQIDLADNTGLTWDIRYPSWFDTGATGVRISRAARETRTTQTEAGVVTSSYTVLPSFESHSDNPVEVTATVQMLGCAGVASLVVHQTMVTMDMTLGQYAAQIAFERLPPVLAPYDPSEEPVIEVVEPASSPEITGIGFNAVRYFVPEQEGAPIEDQNRDVIFLGEMAIQTNQSYSRYDNLTLVSDSGGPDAGVLMRLDLRFAVELRQDDGS